MTPHNNALHHKALENCLVNGKQERNGTALLTSFDTDLSNNLGFSSEKNVKFEVYNFFNQDIKGELYFKTIHA